jgi:hypothetical protein
MARRKNPADDYKFEIVQGPEMTEEEFDSLARLVARMIYDQIMKEQEADNSNHENDSSQEIIK